ncbi:MAG: cytidylate kinase [Gammaproteobacteria bacterium]|nr:cytidylate kinase [Gammaproteobacteria bacterium]
MKNNKIITIDGPSASGKGSLAKSLARELNFLILDSGLLYRAYSYSFIQTGNHSDAVNFFSELLIENVLGEMKVFEDKNEITSFLRDEKVAKSASKISSEKETRDNLITFQRNLINENGLVADGRDMGTVVFPDAATKIFLNADVEIRAKRRFLELQKSNQDVNMRDLIEDIRLRDKADQAREISPLMAAEDSIELDSTNLTPQEVLKKALEIYRIQTKES